MPEKSAGKSVWQFVKDKSCGTVALALIVAFGVLAYLGNKTTLNLFKIGITSEPTQSVPAICRSLLGEATQIRSVLAEQGSTLDMLQHDAVNYANKWDNPGDNRAFGNASSPGPGYLNWQTRVTMINDQRKDFDATVDQLTKAIDQMQQKCNF
jgi:hypothetical protein